MRLSLSLLSLALLFPGARASAADDAGAALREGIASLEAGDLDQAASRLQDAVERLGTEPARRRDLGTAHLYLAMAQLGRAERLGMQSTRDLRRRTGHRQRAPSLRLAAAAWSRPGPSPAAARQP